MGSAGSAAVDGGCTGHSIVLDSDWRRVAVQNADGCAWQHRLDLAGQFRFTDAGHTTRYGPTGAAWRIAMIACRVLPRPMSSARIARRRRSRNATPSTWWGNSPRAMDSARDRSSFRGADRFAK